MSLKNPTVKNYRRVIFTRSFGDKKHLFPRGFILPKCKHYSAQSLLKTYTGNIKGTVNTDQ